MAGVSLVALPVADIHIAQENTRIGDLDGAVLRSREVSDGLYDSGGSIWCALATAALVEALVQRGADGDLREAEAAIQRLAAGADRSRVPCQKSPTREFSRQGTISARRRHVGARMVSSPSTAVAEIVVRTM